MLNFFHSPKKDINFYKILIWEKIFIKSPCHKKKKKTKKKHTHLLPSNIPPHITKRIIPWKFKNPTFLPQKTTKLLPLMPPKKQPFALVPIPKKIHLSKSLERNLLWKGVELPHPPFFTQKNPFWKKKKILTFCPLDLKL